MFFRKNKLQEVRALFDNDYAPSKRFIYDLSLSENPLGHSQEILKVLSQDNKHDFSHYPSKDAETLRQNIADFFNIKSEFIYIGAGVTGIIQDLCKIFVKPNQHILLPESTFPGPIFGATVAGGFAKLVPFKNNFRVDFESIKNNQTSKTAFIFLSNPNNPTGILEETQDIIDLSNEVTCPVLVSEANIEYTGQSLLECDELPKNLIVMRSFSKIYGLAGLRVGYAVIGSDNILSIKKSMNPFRISQLSETICVEALKDRSHIKKSRHYLYNEKKKIFDSLNEIGFSCIPSEGSTFVTQIPASSKNANHLNEELNKVGCAIVPCTNFRGIGKKYIRISPRTHEINETFLKKLKKIV